MLWWNIFLTLSFSNLQMVSYNYLNILKFDLKFFAISKKSIFLLEWLLYASFFPVCESHFLICLHVLQFFKMIILNKVTLQLYTSASSPSSMYTVAAVCCWHGCWWILSNLYSLLHIATEVCVCASVFCLVVR